MQGPLLDLPSQVHEHYPPECYRELAREGGGRAAGDVLMADEKCPV